MIIGINKKGINYLNESKFSCEKDVFYVGRKMYFSEGQVPGFISAQAIFFSEYDKDPPWEVPFDFEQIIISALSERKIEYSNYLAVSTVAQYFGCSQNIENKLSKNLYNKFANLSSQERIDSTLKINVVLDFNEPDDILVLSCFFYTLKKILIPAYSLFDITVSLLGPEVQKDVWKTKKIESLIVGWCLFQYSWENAPFNSYLYLINRKGFSARSIDIFLSGNTKFFNRTIKSKQAFYMDPVHFQLPESYLGVDLINSFWKFYALRRGYNQKNIDLKLNKEQNESESLLWYIKSESQKKSKVLLEKYFYTISELNDFPEKVSGLMTLDAFKIDPEDVSAKIENEFCNGILFQNNLQTIISQAEKEVREIDMDLLRRATLSYTKNIGWIRSKNGLALLLIKITGLHKQQIGNCRSNLKVILLHYLKVRGLKMLIVCLKEFKKKIDLQVYQAEKEYLKTLAAFNGSITDLSAIELRLTQICKKVWEREKGLLEKIRNGYGKMPDDLPPFDTGDYMGIKDFLEETAVSERWFGRSQESYLKGWLSYCGCQDDSLVFAGLLCSNGSAFKDKFIKLLENEQDYSMEEKKFPKDRKLSLLAMKPLMEIIDYKEANYMGTTASNMANASHESKMFLYNLKCSENVILCLTGPIHLGTVLFNCFERGDNDPKFLRIAKDIFNAVFSKSEIDFLESYVKCKPCENNCLDLIRNLSERNIPEMKKEVVQNIVEGINQTRNKKRLEILTWMEKMEKAQ